MAISVSRAGPNLVRVRGRNVPPDFGGAGREPRRVDEAASRQLEAPRRQRRRRPPASARSPSAAAGDSEMRAGDRGQPRRASRGSAPSARTNATSFSSDSPPASPLGVNSQGRPLKRSGRACSRPLAAAPPSGWPPMNVNRDGNALRRFDDFPLRAAGIGDDRRLAHVLVERLEQHQVLSHRRRQNDQVRLRQHHQHRLPPRRWRAAASPFRARPCCRRRSRATPAKSLAPPAQSIRRSAQGR